MVQNIKVPFKGYSLEPGRFETKSLEKYLGVFEEVCDVDILKTIAESDSKEPLIIIASNLNLYQQVLDSSNKKIILIHLSDEAYDVKKSELYKHPNIILILRNNYLFPLSFLLKSAFKWPYWMFVWGKAYWLRDKSLITNLKNLKHLFLSRRYLLRQIRFARFIKKISAKVICFPLNETNFYIAGENDEPIARIFDVCFAGSLHSPERVIANESATKLGYSHGYYAEWGPGGGGSLEPIKYVQLMKSSFFTLSPNGHVNQDCFRFYEALCANSLPIVPKGTPYQPFSYYKYVYGLDSRLEVVTFDEKSIRKSIDSIDEHEKKMILEKLKLSVSEHNVKARNVIHTLMRVDD
jgi:hypothetical protein